MIFKKQISLLIAFLVLVSNSGLAFNIHFCEGEIASITSIFTKAEVCEMPVQKEVACCLKQEPTHDECCSDKEVSLKNNVEKVIVKISIDSNYLLAYHQFIPLEYTHSTTKKIIQEVVYNFDANAPPLYQLYCQYTLYA